MMKSRKAPQKKAAGRSRAAPASRAADAPFAVPKLQRNTLNEEVYEQLKQALMTGRIAPGATMTIRSLAASFGISPMPVREALRRLVAEHVLFLLPNRSVSMPVVTRERFREITRIRTSLEGLAAEEATPLIDSGTIDRMAQLNDEMEREDAAKTPDYLVKNRELHFSLYRACQMPTLVKIIESLWLQIGPLLTIQQGIYVKAGITVQTHHRRLLKALRKRNAQEARVSIVDDIEDAAKLIADAL